MEIVEFSCECWPTRL